MRLDLMKAALALHPLLCLQYFSCVSQTTTNFEVLPVASPQPDKKLSDAET